jgi:hypothetical protein
MNKKVPEVLQLFIPASLAVQVEAPTAKSALHSSLVCTFNSKTLGIFTQCPKNTGVDNIYWANLLAGCRIYTNTQADGYISPQNG